ncbi:NAD(P)/FAD-dependent oxidoreductase [Mycolicibacterium insubricum]|nr:FAD-dependent oxidoreductase [Mycolicibacterium insubricum]BBZ64712.1 NAD(P)/FAD-dependent oxidoreductase [Mycolicibacterium insubricum]
MLTEESKDSFDTVIVGAGAGGVAAAALLHHKGYRTLLVEAEPQVGGRASTIRVDGYGINTGAQIFELGGANAELFEDVGVQIRARKQAIPLVLRLGRRDIQVMSGFSGMLVNKVVIPTIGGLARRFGWFRPSADLTLAEWLIQLRVSESVRRLVRNLSSAMFAAEPCDVSAQVFFDYLTKKGGMNPYGAHPDGSIGPWQDLVDHYQRSGGNLLLKTRVVGIDVGSSGLVDGLRLEDNEGLVTTVHTKSVVSNVGPVATGNLIDENCWPSGYLASLLEKDYPGTLITLNFSTSKPIPNLKTLTFFGLTRRMAYAAYVSGPSPRLAPPGKHLYCVSSTPHPASSGFDTDTEVQLLKEEAAAAFPGFSDAHIISVAVCTGDWPGQRAIPGRDWPNETPIPNLWNVGDGARPPLGAGLSGCVESARLVVTAVDLYHRKGR